MLQIIINKLLSLDSGLEQYLQQLHGKYVAIICRDMPIHTTYCLFDNKQIHFSSSVPHHIDVTITSTWRGFIQYALTKNPLELQITGDATIASLVEKLYLQLDIDWEDELAKFTGDIIAHQALNYLRQAKQYSQDTRSSLREMITEYLQEESDLVPTKTEVDEFMSEVDELRLRVDRLEARIKAYESN